MRKSILLLSLILSSFLFSQLFAQEIYPIPQHLQEKGEFAYKGVRSYPDFLKEFQERNGLQIKEKKDKGLPFEGYRLDVTPKKITIFYASERGKFYAYQSLKQLLTKGKETGLLPVVQIEDAPDIAFRGTVEGFYGEPWTQEDRISQLRFYGDWKLNTYIYGPKDDPYHSSPKWREAYPEEEANKLKELVGVAKKNHVDFYWAIHPGKDIKWNKTDSLAVLHKFELMYDLGIRHFAVFFDDISGEGTNAEKQAGLLNYLQKEFLDTKHDVGALIMCPTEYNKAWSNPKDGTYLDLLGEQLDPRIHIMWTGNTVIHDITLEGQQWVNQRIQRPSFVWWNFPVSDYVRNHLLLGAAYGLDKNAKEEMSGFVSNPMDKPEASKVAIFSIANYSWNLQGYDAEETWNEAIDRLFPEVSEAYKLFSRHNADPGPSYHQYRRIESPTIGEILDQQVKNIESGSLETFSPQDYQLLSSELSKFTPAAQQILSQMKNRTLVDELHPWLQYFAIQGQAAQLLLKMTQSEDLDVVYKNFVDFQEERDKMIAIDQTENRNPYQPGIVSASRHVLPWIEQSYVYFHKLLKDAGYEVKDAANQVHGKVFTNIQMLSSLPVVQGVVTGNRPLQTLKLSRMLEYIPFGTDDYLGIEITSDSKIKEVKYQFDEKVEGFAIEYSMDGSDWQDKKFPDAKFVRLVNKNPTNQTVRLQNFEVIFE